MKKKADGTIAQPLFVCALDETPWLSEDEAVAHVLKNHFATFYQTDRIATEPPKGVYTFVAQCSISGVILGPPNHHDYQNQLRKLHSERFSRMPFDAYKAGVKIVRDEAVVKKWIEDQSFKTEYTVLNVPEPLKLATLEDVENHFRATHKETIIKSVETLVVGGVLSRNLRSRGLQQLIRQEWEAAAPFPVAARQHVEPAVRASRPAIFQGQQDRHARRRRAPAISRSRSHAGFREHQAHRVVHQRTSEMHAPEIDRDARAGAPEPTVLEVKPDAAPAPAAEATPEQTAIIADLHWLAHQGHIIEFADGKLETAKKPLPKPVKPEKKPAAEKVRMKPLRR